MRARASIHGGDLIRAFAMKVKGSKGRKSNCQDKTGKSVYVAAGYMMQIIFVAKNFCSTWIEHETMKGYYFLDLVLNFD